MTDKQAAATFKTNDLFSDQDQDNELENFILEQKLLSSGLLSPAARKALQPYEKSINTKDSLLDPKTFKYKIPYYRMSHESRRNEKGKLGENSLDPSTIRYSWKK